MRRLVTLFTIVIALFTLASCGASRKAAQKNAYLNNTYVDLRETLNEAEVTILNDTIKVLFPEHLLFQKSSAELNADVAPLMLRFANALIKYNKTDILINGYTDDTGGDDLNRKLSQQRADNARAMLQSNGVLPERMMSWGLGSKNPIADNATAEGKAKNRRVEFIILYTLR